MGIRLASPAFVLVAASTSGCATALRTVWPDPAPPAEIKVSYRPAPEGLGIRVSLPPAPPAPGRPDFKDWIGGGLDALVER